MTPEYEIVGQAPAAPLPGLELTAAQVAGQAPIAVAQAAPVAAAGVSAVAAPVRRATKKPELVSVDPDGRQAVVRDVLGRTVVVKPLSVVQQMRLVGFLGRELSTNGAYMSFAAIGSSVHSVDGEQVAMISDRNSLERVMAKLGDDALAAAAVGLSALMPKDDEQAFEDEAKNV